MPPGPSTFPILMYHKVGEPVSSPADTFLNVSARDFGRQMGFLARMGYAARPFAEIVEAVDRGLSLPSRTFAITFDDGYSGIGRHAAPILAERRFPATVFVVSSGAGKTNAWDEITGRPLLSLLTWQELEDLQRVGWEIGGHTRTHPHLSALGDSEAYAEILLGKQEAEAALRCKIRTFCYPFGHFNGETPSLVQKAGFEGACTTQSGLAHRGAAPYTLPRVKVAYRDGVLGLLYRLLVRPYLPDLRTRRSASRAHRHGN